MKNIVIIGMPGAGKSTMGVILARTLGMQFIDTDSVVQEHAGRPLQEIIDAEGTGSFLKAEEEAVLSLHCQNTVIATGGSVVFSSRAMKHLKEGGVVLYLKISLDAMERRIGNSTTRGIVRGTGQTLPEMYRQRIPLYEQFADITIECPDRDFEECIGSVTAELAKFRA
jgi:shikimate kinase